MTRPVRPVARGACLFGGIRYELLTNVDLIRE